MRNECGATRNEAIDHDRVDRGGGGVSRFFFRENVTVACELALATLVFGLGVAILCFTLIVIAATVTLPANGSPYPVIGIILAYAIVLLATLGYTVIGRCKFWAWLTFMILASVPALAWHLLKGS